ncbi:MAG: STAS domain-containing protein [Francisellaceae bacterium]|jgi:HptB-dependent secretion and biofilm anti anti-sigma factor|nr:STAS domain-containing protein [Francisellaceae bacterium]MBT6207325.1 STAS domain-containing protein [Francisellaceae bacterium]MBT6539677.1 STAS domain-containing protein [Francisellaceae bacterium]
MSISSELEGDALVIKVQGRFDFSALEVFKNSYENVEPTPGKYVVDLEGSDYLDSSALGMLLRLREFAGGDDADVSILNCNPDVKKILVVTKLDEMFNVE